MSVYTELPEDEQNEDEQIITVGDDILSSFYYGNYSQGIQELIDYEVQPEELAEYLVSLAEEYDMPESELYGGHFTASLWVSIGRSYDTETRK